MSATLLGDDVGVWGPSADETGVIISDLSHDYQAGENELKARDGCTQALVLFDEKVDISLEGEVPATSAASHTIGDSLSYANSVSYDHLTASSGGENLLKRAQKRFPREGWQTFQFGSTLYPYITITP